MGGISYIFPDVALQDTDILEPDYFNGPLVDAADKYSGNLNEHAFKTSLLASMAWDDIDESCFGRPLYVKQQASPQLSNAPSAAPTFSTADDGWQVPNHGNWETVDTLEQTISTGSCQLFIVAQLSFMWELCRSTSMYNDGSAVQFALRLDGVIIDDTITGHINFQYRTYRPAKAVSERGVGTTLPGPALIRSDIVAGLGLPAAPHRFIYVTPFTVPPGSHTIQVVVRRVPNRSTAYVYSSTDNVWIFNRRMLTFDIPINAATQSTYASVTVDLVESEDGLSALDLTTKYEEIRDAYNSVEPGALARGALNWHQLPQRTLLDTEIVTLDPVTFSTATNVFQSATSTTITGSSSGNGWYLLNDGTNNLQFSGTLDVSDKKCMVVILGNVEFRDLTPNSGSPYSQFAASAIFYTNGGGTSLIEESVDYWMPWIQHSGAWINECSEASLELDVPFFACIDYTSSAAPSDITAIGFYTAGTTVGGANAPTNVWQRGSLIVITLRY